jgi:hypothetical protein
MGTVGAPFLETLCWPWIQSKGPSASGGGLRKAQREEGWFSEPPSKELGHQSGAFPTYIGQICTICLSLETMKHGVANRGS